MCDVSLCSGPQILAKLEASRVLQSRFLFCGLTLCFPGICEFFFTKTGLMPEHKHKDQVSFAILFDFNFAFIFVTYCLLVCYFLLSSLYFDKGPFYSQTL